MLASAAPGPWPDGFTPYTFHHTVSSIAWASIAFGLVLLAARWRGTSAENHLRTSVVSGVAVSQALMVVYWLEPARFSWGTSLPLHMCDLVAWLTPLALLVRWRPVRAVVFFWGLGLTTQAFVQPTLLYGLQHGVYWFFWVQHAAVLLGGLYLWVVLGYRPGRSDFAFVGGLSAAAAAITALVNWQTGWEYFFTGPEPPENDTIIDYLGPWPLRVVWLWCLAMGAMAIIWGLSVVASRFVDAPRDDAPDGTAAAERPTSAS
ncbi:MAG: TIGR02206 family membrane protein [Planctomycetota bacterium]